MQYLKIIRLIIFKTKIKNMLKNMLFALCLVSIFKKDNKVFCQLERKIRAKLQILEICSWAFEATAYNRNCFYIKKMFDFLSIHCVNQKK